ncbi:MULTISPECIES: biopolymer transporter ExbD [unclassified Brevundimonas]|jgi:biopolymer transport protein ExbD|uniref:biopolymer transporter ExbD n=1 Tax=unclassified Brevundimonas TaxID=2622653 RepID=UPI001A32C364|nr:MULTISPECIES: biopolymer transporter ExbD [unclassified Brevundimonas]MBJ7486375.1 biopolymer transporter ExbD [Brevundimonas sp.]WGM48390.1 Biopolymer transport protein ExbD [Brevundimonas sp. NIBR10]
MAGRLSGPGASGGKTIEQNSDINVTPFVDIMLVLLIIFMVSAPLATVSIKLDLPPATPPPITPEKPKDPVYVTIQDTGSIFLADRQTTIETLAVDACAALGDPTGQGCKEERLFVRAQPEVKYSQFMEVMNTLQTNGFYKVGLLNEDIT